MTYNETYKILSFESEKLITTKLYCPPKIVYSSSLVVQSNMEPKITLNSNCPRWTVAFLQKCYSKW